MLHRENILAEVTKNRLLPDRHKQRELFLCDINDVVLKDDMASMEHPFFALSTKPDTNPRHYQHGDVSVSVVPSVRGLATIFDKDILIYIVSKLKAGMNNEGADNVSQTVHFTARDLLIFTNRDVGGHSYNNLLDALERLAGTRIRTSIETAGEGEVSGFGLIEKYKVKAKNKKHITEWSVTLSDWLFRAAQASELLTLNSDYFQIRRPLDRRIYELVRKHCGNQEKWSCNLTTLHKKSGSRAELKEFRRSIRELCREDLLPDYSLSLEADKLTARLNKFSLTERIVERSRSKQLPSEIGMQRARQHLRGYAVDAALEAWNAFITHKAIEVQNADAHFIDFCKKWVKKKPRIAGY